MCVCPGSVHATVAIHVGDSSAKHNLRQTLVFKFISQSFSILLKTKSIHTCCVIYVWIVIFAEIGKKRQLRSHLLRLSLRSVAGSYQTKEVWTHLILSDAWAMLNISHMKDSTGAHTTQNTRCLLIQPFISTTVRMGTRATSLQLCPTCLPLPWAPQNSRCSCSVPEVWIQPKAQPWRTLSAVAIVTKACNWTRNQRLKCQNGLTHFEKK